MSCVKLTWLKMRMALDKRWRLASLSGVELEWHFWTIFGGIEVAETGDGNRLGW